MPSTPSFARPSITASRDFGLAVDGRGVDVLFGITAHLRHGLIDDWALLGLDLRVGKEQRRVEVAEEQPLGEAELLRSGEEQLFGLLLLLFHLLAW